MIKKSNFIFIFLILFPFSIYSKTSFASGGISMMPVADSENGGAQTSFITAVNPDGSISVQKGTNFKVNITPTGEVTVLRENTSLKILENGNVERSNIEGGVVEVERNTNGNPLAVDSPPISMKKIDADSTNPNANAASNPISMHKVSSDPISMMPVASHPISMTPVASGPISMTPVSSGFMKKFVGTGQ